MLLIANKKMMCYIMSQCDLTLHFVKPTYLLSSIFYMFVGKIIYTKVLYVCIVGTYCRIHIKGKNKLLIEGLGVFELFF